VERSRGAYGFRISGIGGLSRLGPVPAHWPELRLESGPPNLTPSKPPGTTEVGEHSAILWLPDGSSITLRRQDASVRFEMPQPPSAEMIAHPLLGLPAAIMSLWQGRLALHGGAFLVDAGAWALIGDRGSGKSTSLAQMLTLGHAILSDDILVIEGREMYRGPRAIDLRAESAARFGGAEMGIMGTRARWRLDAGDSPAVVPLLGFVKLEWGQEVSIRALEILGLPAWEFTRPEDLDQSMSALGQLLSVLGDDRAARRDGRAWPSENLAPRA
jgi:hypothetical protein